MGSEFVYMRTAILHVEITLRAIATGKAEKQEETGNDPPR